jgi:hypothetical protein
MPEGIQSTRRPISQLDVSSAGSIRHGSYMAYDERHIYKPHFGCIGLQSVFVCIAGTHVKHWVDQSYRETAHLGMLGSPVPFSSRYSSVVGDYVSRMYQRYVPPDTHPSCSFRRYYKPCAWRLYPFRPILLPIALSHIICISERTLYVFRANQ